MNLNPKVKAALTAILIVLSVSFTLLAPTGCGTLAPEGAYKSDKALYVTDQLIVSAYATFNEFVLWEFQNRAALNNQDVTKAADKVRVNARRWIDTAINLRDVYSADPTPDNRRSLQTAIAVLRTAMAEAAGYTTLIKSHAQSKP